MIYVPLRSNPFLIIRQCKISVLTAESAEFAEKIIILKSLILSVLRDLCGLI